MGDEWSLSSTDATSPAWARVRILLNLAQRQAALREAVAALESLHFQDGDLIRMGGPCIYGLGDLPVGFALMHPARDLVLLNQDVANEFFDHIGFHRFTQSITQLPRPAFRPYQVEDFERLARA